MKRKKSSPSFVLWVSAAVLMACGRATALPAEDLQHNIAVGKFQAAIQQQNFFTILTSIEERLKNLDNVYSVQLSQTLETKLDQYSRRLEALDTKIIRLEALVMLNLDKISENISTKNFKDDMSRTSLLRKMDSVYEGISHRLGYMDRKYETNLAKIQTRVDNTLTRLEKIEENITIRDSDIEAEISDAIFAIDDLKTTCATMEEKLYNMTTTSLNVTKNTFQYLQDVNVDSRKSMNLLHDNIIENLKFMNNMTLRHFKVGEENNIMLKKMKLELKEDFNDYASKVADMSSYIWKNKDTIQDDLKTLQVVVNNTKIEVQNGVRSLMVQIGKTSNKEKVMFTGNDSLDEINKNLKTNFQRILTNQDLFLESCHRLQMDESQIESEISDMLEKLIDMLEKKMASEMKDIKNLEKALKSHDSRIVRNAYQINSNVISLFEKSTTNYEALLRQVKKISNDLDALFQFVQSTVTSGSSLTSVNIKELQDALNKLENQILSISRNQTQPKLEILNATNFSDITLKNITEQISKTLTSIQSHIENTLNNEDFEKILNKISQRYFDKYKVETDTKVDSTYEIKIDNDTRKVIDDIFGPNPTLDAVENVGNSKKNCKQNYRNLINVRSGASDNCEDTQEKRRNKKNKKRKKKGPLINLRGHFESEENTEYDEIEENLESTTTDYSHDLTTDEVSTTETITSTTTNNFLVTTPNDTINKI